MFGKIVGWLIYGAALAGLLFLGWHEPLSYRFMSRKEIYTLEHPTTPAPAPPPATPQPGAWMKDPSRRTKLDERRESGVGSVGPRQTPYPTTGR